MLCCTQQFECVSSHSVAKPHSRSVTPNRPTFARLHHTNPALLRTCQFLMIFCNIELSFQFCAHLFCRPHLPKMPHRLQFLTFWNANRALAITSCTFFLRSSRETAETETLLRPPQESHTIPEKKHGFAPESALVTYEITRFRMLIILFSTAPTRELLLLTMLLIWWSHDDLMVIFDDMMKRLPLDICPWLEVFELNFLW